MAKIYLSSTYSDFKEHREPVYRALRKMRHDIIAMENYVATDQRPLDKCLEDVADCDLYIGLFAWRYGYIPVESNPEQKSITELEYRTALKMGKPTLLFLLDENALWPPKWMDSQTGDGKAGASILALRQEFLRDKLVSTFQGKDDIANVVIHAVHDWEKRHNLTATADPFLSMRTRYLEQVYHRYSSVKLPIGSPQGLSLHAIFQPLTLRRDPLVVENLTRDKRRMLLGETSEEYERKHSSDGQDDIYPLTQDVTAENAEAALKKSYQQRMVVLGGPGTGKTTTLKYLAAQQAKEALENTEASIPIYLSLAALARSGKSLQRYLLDIVEDMDVDPAYADLLWREMQNGHAYTCLDSLDEVDPKMRSDMIDLINRKAQEPGNVWIVGSRFTEYKGGQFKAGQFSDWEIQPMSASLRKELTRRLFPELRVCLNLTQQEMPTAQTFVSLLEQHPRASAWGENPLLLSLAAVVFLQQGYLPASRILLYQHVIEAVLATREPDPIHQKILLRMLIEFALWVHQQRGRTFTTEDLINFFMEEQHRSWGETHDLAYAVVNSGIVEIVARQTYGFRHQTFQEYLAASELARRLVGTDAQLREQAEAFVWHKRTYSRWTEILRMVAGILVQNYRTSGLRKASQWIEKLAQQHTSDEGDPGFLNFSLALIAISELGEISEWHSPQTVKLEIAILEIWFNELVLAAQRSQGSKEVRLTSLTSEIIHFQKSSVNSIFDKIVATLKDKSRAVREMCIRTLENFGPRSIDVLLQLLQDETFNDDVTLLRVLKNLSADIPLEPLLNSLHHEATSVRSRTLQIIGNLGERAPLQPLLEALHDKHASVRAGAITALGNLGERTPLEPLLDALHDTNISVKCATIRALGNLGERAPLQPLLAVIYDNDLSIQHAVSTALEHLGKRAPLNILLSNLQNTNFFVRQMAVRTLGNLEERAPLQPLLDALHDTNIPVRREAIRALGNLGEHTPLAPLLAALHDIDSSVQQEAAQALKKQNDVVIEQMLADEVAGVIRSPYLCRIAIKILGEIGKHIPLTLLLHALHDIDPFMRQTAVEALGIPDERGYLEILIEALHDTHASVRREAAFTLRKWRKPTPFEPLIIEPLLDALHDSDPSVRQVVAVTLGVMGTNVPLAALLEALQDTNSQVRSASLIALKFIGERVPLDYLLNALHDEVPNVRSEALAALGEQGKHTPLPLNPLLDALHDTDSSVRSAAITALSNLGIDAPIDPLLDALHDTDSLVRCAAITALGNQGKRTPINLLLDALHDTDYSIRRAAVRALGNQGERTPLQPLLDALHDTDLNVQNAAGQALGKLGDRVPLEPLLNALHDGDEWTQHAAVIALGQLGECTPLEPLLDVLYREGTYMRGAAIDALSNMGKRVPLEPLFEMLQDDAPWIRREAIRIIQEREPEALQPLSQEALAVLHDEPPGPIFRSIAFGFLAETLGNIGSASPEMLEKLTKLLQWPYWQVRMKAAKALGQIRRNIPDEAIRRLLVLQRNTHPHNRAVQKAADDALAEILTLETGIEDE